MMKICLLVTAVAAAQAPQQPQPAPAQPGAPAPSSPASPASAIPDSQPVITIHGLCPSSAASTAGTAKTASRKAATPAANCVTTVTKAQLEKLISVLNADHRPLTPQVRLQFAQNYAELLTYAAAAKKAGTEDADFAETMRFLRLRTLASVYRSRLEEQYKNPSPSEIEAYYKQNAPKYEELKLSRIFIPAKNPSAQDKDKDAYEKKAAELANQLHDRAAKGEDMEKLQKEAYTTLGLTTAPFNTDIGQRRHGMLPATQEQELFALKPGEISKLEQEAAGYSIYKVDSRDTIPLDKVKDEISRELAREKMDAKTKEINAGIHADLNDNYFGPAVRATSPSLVPPGAAARPGAAPATTSPNASPAPQPQPTGSPTAPKP